MKQWYAHAMPLIGKKCYAAYYGRSEPCKLCPSCQTIKTGNPAQEVMPRINAVGTVSGWLDMHSYPLIDVSTGDFTGVIEYVRDITEHKKADEALRESENKFQTIVKNASDGIVLIDENGCVIEWNYGQEQISGLKSEEVLGQPVWEVLFRIAPPAPETRIISEFIKTSIQEFFSAGHADWINHLSEREITRPDGSRRIMQTTYFPLSIKQRTMLGSISRDITEIREAEAAARKNEENLQTIKKLESLGQLAGGLAHDFNNLLSVMLGHIELARLNITGESPSIANLIAAEKACQKAAELSNKLITFSKGGSPINKIISLAPILKETSELVVAGSAVTCRISIPDNLWLVNCDPGQIEQAFRNVITNAREAMPEGGSMDIQAENEIIAKEQTSLPQPGKYVRVSIKDYGAGIKSEHIDEIFDPYFTTKPMGNQTGNWFRSFSYALNY